MGIKIGDRVKFISDTRCGVVKNMSNSLAMVDVDGFEIPVQISELVAIDEDEEKKAFRIMGGEERNEIRGHRGDKQHKQQHTAPRYNAPSYGRISLDSGWEDEPLELPKRSSGDNAAITEFYGKMVAEKAVQPEEEEVPFNVSECVVKLMFVPSNGNNAPERSDLDMYLVNDSSYRIYYSIAQWVANDYVEMIAKGEMEADSMMRLTTMQRKTLNEIMQLQISVLPFKPEKFIPVDGASGKLELHPLKFVKSKNYVKNDYFDEPAIEYSLIDNTK